MEEDEEYLIATSTLKKLLKRQQQLIDHGNKITKTHSENQREIESHFSSCFKALQARKDTLMSDLDNQFNDQRMILSHHFPHVGFYSFGFLFHLNHQKNTCKNHNLHCKQQLKDLKIS
jgi:hypothetical protein